MRTPYLVLFVVAAAMFALPFTARAATNKTISTFDTAGTAVNSIVAGNYAYVVDQGVGIIVLDIANPAAPTQVGSYALTEARAVDIDGNNLYVAAGTSGLVILSIATPTTPTLLGSYTGMTLVGNVASAGSFVYITGYNSPGSFLLQAIDVTTPAAPSLAAGTNTLSIAVSAGLTLSGNYVYVVGDQQMQIINAYPILTVAGTYTDPNGSSSYQGIQVFGSIAYINDIVTGLHAVNIASPAAPTATYNSGGRYGVGITISNGYVFLNDNFGGGLAIYDIASSSTPTYIDSYSGPATNYGLTVANNIAFISAGASGLQLVDVSKPDIVPPVVTPAGPTTTTVTPGSKYVDPGVTVDPGSTVTTTGTVNTSKVGRYVITYTVVDRVGNTTVIQRVVYVGPTLSNVTVRNNTLTIRVSGRNVLLRPFPGYTGAMVAKKVVLDRTSNPFYLFIKTQTRYPQMAVYDVNGRLKWRVSLSAVSSNGLLVQLAPNPVSSSVYIALAPTSGVMNVTMYNLTKSNLYKMKTFNAAGGRGTLVMAFLKNSSTEYALMTKVKNTSKSPYVWRYKGGKTSWYRDTTFDLSRLIWGKTYIKLR